MTNTQDHVMMRARTKIQASGELKVEWRSSVKVFLDPRTDGDPASPFLLSMTIVVVVDVRAEEQRHRDQMEHIKYFYHNIPNIPGIDIPKVICSKSTTVKQV